MKKILFLASLAAVAMTSCTSESNEYVGGNDNTPKEIAFMPLAQKATRANAFSPFSETAFPDNYTMEVSANLNGGGVYFSDVLFSKGEGTTWKGGQYWPLSACTLNFLAVTNWTTTPTSVVSTAFTDGAKQATVTLGNNQPTDLTAPSAQTGAQHDLMYAVGRGIVSQSTAISYTGNEAGDAAPVDMIFKHALAWVNFTVKTNASYTGFKLRYIKLLNAYYGGTYTLDNTTNYNYAYDGSTYNSRTATAITGTWSSPTNQGASIAVPGWTGASTDLTTTPVPVGNGLVVVPTNGITPATNSFTGFEIGYTFNGQDFTYTYSNNVVLEQAKKYTYAINFTLTEIEINPSVTDWGAGSGADITI